MQVMLNGADRPGSHLIGCFYDVVRIVKHPVVEVTVPSDRPFRSTILFVFSGQHRVHLNDNLRFCHVTLPNLFFFVQVLVSAVTLSDKTIQHQ
jgi:hypothetical protein